MDNTKEEINAPSAPNPFMSSNAEKYDNGMIVDDDMGNLNEYENPLSEYQLLTQEAQSLNEKGASFIERGNYEDAVIILAKALHVAESCVELERLLEPSPQQQQQNPKQSNEKSSSYVCNLEDCMAYSELCYAKNKQTRSDCSTHTATIDGNYMDAGCKGSTTTYSSSAEFGYIYDNPLRIPPPPMTSSCNCDDMDGDDDIMMTTSQGPDPKYRLGMILPLIIVFNLALAQHLMTLREKEISKKRYQKVMHLYEFAYKWQLQDEHFEATQLASLRFTMVISNNLGEIHRAVKNHSKHKMCLQHLLSTMMFAVDSWEHEQDALELDGFLRNASTLILKGHCAEAA